MSSYQRDLSFNPVVHGQYSVGTFFNDLFIHLRKRKRERERGNIGGRGGGEGERVFKIFLKFRFN